MKDNKNDILGATCITGLEKAVPNKAKIRTAFKLVEVIKANICNKAESQVVIKGYLEVTGKCLWKMDKLHNDFTPKLFHKLTHGEKISTDLRGYKTSLLN